MVHPYKLAYCNFLDHYFLRGGSQFQGMSNEWGMGIKDTCRKSYVMRPLSDRKNCEQHLIAHFQWRFLRFQIEFLAPLFFSVW